MALSHLARLALKNASAQPHDLRVEAYQTVAAALYEDCPDIAKAASKAASQLSQANETQLRLFKRLDA